MIRHLIPALIAGTSLLANAAPAELRESARKTMDAHKDAIVWLSVLSKTTMSVDGEAPDQIADPGERAIAERGRYIVMTSACADCHSAAKTSSSSRDHLMPTHESCQSCHEEQIANTCSYCHTDHSTQYQDAASTQ